MDIFGKSVLVHNCSMIILHSAQKQYLTCFIIFECLVIKSKSCQFLSKVHKTNGKIMKVLLEIIMQSLAS